uniref:Ypar21 n=1 Tax=Aquipseudomonas alcaligenes TaxID=43263 RepID=Q939F2_AQUAC|nr:Ypar21 [Pseudomonas alcaligenes]
MRAWKSCKVTSTNNVQRRSQTCSITSSAPCSNLFAARRASRLRVINASAWKPAQSRFYPKGIGCLQGRCGLATVRYSSPAFGSKSSA